MFNKEFIILEPIYIIGSNRPLILFSNQELQEKLEYIKEEIERRGGYESLSQIVRSAYDNEISLVLEEIALRN